MRLDFDEGVFTKIQDTRYKTTQMLHMTLQLFLSGPPSVPIAQGRKAHQCAQWGMGEQNGRQKREYYTRCHPLHWP